MFRQFTHKMELYIIEDFRDCFPELQGSALTDALIMDCIEAYGICNAKVCRTEKGKPYVEIDGGKDTSVFVSVSHSGDYFLCLVADVPVGIDVQHARRVKVQRISSRYFTSKEQQYMEAHGEAGFFTLWTRKEAYSKYVGTGLEEILRGTEVLDREDVTFLDFQLEKGVYCSCCIKR